MEQGIRKISVTKEGVIRDWRRRIFKNLNSKFLFILKVYLCLSVLELILFPSLYVAFALLVSYLGIALTRLQLCRTTKLLHYPLSTISLLFFCLFFEIMPLPATMAELKPIVYNLRNPFQTFLSLFLIQCALLLTHNLYVRLTNRRNFLRDIFRRLNFFTGFSSQEIWFLIIGSLIWYAFVMLTQGFFSEDNKNVNSLYNVTEWAISLFFSSYYLIVFIFFFRKFNNIKSGYQIHWLPIILIAIVDFVIGIGTNMRTAAVLVFANAVFMVILYFIYYPETFRLIKRANVVITLGLAALFFAGPFQIISEAMVSVRHQRTGKNALEVLEMTRSVKKNDTVKLQVEKQHSLAWDEEYLRFDMLNRFCSLKIWDETIFHARRLNQEQRQMMRLSLYTKLVDQMPGVFKTWLGIHIDPNERESSLSDYLLYLSTDGRYYPGGMKIGSLPGLGFALFGYWLPLVLIPLYFVMFFLIDSMVLYRGTRFIFPLFVFANMLNFAGLFSDRHYYLYELRFIFRGYWEMVIFYLISVNIVKRLPFLKH